MGFVLLSVLTPTGSYVSEMIDVGTSTPRVRRYSRQWDLFSNANRQ